MADCLCSVALPCAIVVSYSDTNASDIVKGILQQDQLTKCLPVYSDSIQTYPWAIDTKYYTADIHLCIVKDEKFGNGEVLENMQALVVHFDNSKEASFNRVKVLMSLVDGFEPEVRLLVCDNCSQGTLVSRLAAQEWCLKNGFELVELYPDDLSDSEDDFAETTGMKRIIQALHAHTWSNLIMKEKSSLFSPQLNSILKSEASESDELDEIKDDLEASLANVKIEELQKDNSKQGLPDQDLLDALENDSSGQSFEALFDAFQQMKEKAKDLHLSERKVYAEKVAIAFWKAMGGDEDEIAGLDSDED